MLSGKIYKLVEKEKFDDCIGLVKDLTHEQVDKIAMDLPVALILSKVRYAFFMYMFFYILFWNK